MRIHLFEFEVPIFERNQNSSACVEAKDVTVGRHSVCSPSRSHTSRSLPWPKTASSKLTHQGYLVIARHVFPTDCCKNGC